jgi:hypothetical protein
MPQLDNYDRTTIARILELTPFCLQVGNPSLVPSSSTEVAIHIMCVVSLPAPILQEALLNASVNANLVASRLAEKNENKKQEIIGVFHESAYKPDR